MEIVYTAILVISNLIFLNIGLKVYAPKEEKKQKTPSQFKRIIRMATEPIGKKKREERSTSPFDLGM